MTISHARDHGGGHSGVEHPDGLVSDAPGSARLDRWWGELTAAALVGTARRPPPAPPGGPLPSTIADSSPEVALLDAAAMGSALRRAGALPRHPSRQEQPAGADPDQLAPPPARARQLLDLLLTQPPVGARLAPRAVEGWLREAARHGVRVHHATLVPLLVLATRTPQLRDAARPVLDNRGAWLAAANPAWQWAMPRTTVAGDAVDPGRWARLATERRALQVRVMRATDPGGARALVESTWRTDPAVARAELVAALEVGLSLDDEPLLERALDDRSPAVREVAYRLLDGLPGSDRARRLGEVLAPLLSSTGALRRRARVELPSAPTPVAVRDGLGEAPPGRSERGLRLQRLAAGAPLETWGRATGLEPRTVVATLEDPDALAGLRAAVVARRDATWARALLQRGWDPGLVRCLPAEEMGDRVLARVAAVATAPDLLSAVRLAPPPWSAQVSATVVARLATVPRAPQQLPDLVAVLADGLHPSAAPAVARLAAAEDGRSEDLLAQLAQYLSFVPTLEEAFS